MPVYFVGFQVIKLMNLHFFHCHLSFSNTTAFICVLTITPVWVRLNLSIIETVFSLCPPLPYNFHPPFPLFFFLPLFLTAAFHVTAVSRWTAPLTPNAKSGTEQHFELCLSIFLFFFYFLNTTENLWCQHMPVCWSIFSFLSLLVVSQDLSLSCQTVWTQQDRKVRPVVVTGQSRWWVCNWSFSLDFLESTLKVVIF